MRRTDRRGWVREFVYDDADRITSELWLAAPGVPGGPPGATVRTISYSYSATDELISASDADSAYGFAYDPAGRLRSLNNAGTPLVPPVTLSYSHDLAGRRTRLADTLGGYVTTTYDAAGRPSEIFQSGRAVTAKGVTLAYNKRGQTTRIDRHQGSVGGTTATALVTHATYTYDDAAARLTDLRHSGPGLSTLDPGPLLDRVTLSYDPGDRIISVAMSSAPVGPQTWNFSYDRTDQVTGVSGLKQESYAYDANGNRRTSSVSGGGSSDARSYAMIGPPVWSTNIPPQLMMHPIAGPFFKVWIG